MPIDACALALALALDPWPHHREQAVNAAPMPAAQQSQQRFICTTTRPGVITRFLRLRPTTERQLT